MPDPPDRPVAVPPRHPLARTLALLGAFAVAAAGFAFRYAVGCEGRWDGPPLDESGAIDLASVKERLAADVRHVAGMGPRHVGDDAAYARLTACADWIDRTWTAQGYRVERQEYAVAGRTCANLAVEVPGAVAPEEIVIVSAQYDTLPPSPGANNNGSGMAALFRISELLRGRRAGRTVRLVEFVNEEDPWFGTDLMGSRVYAKACRARGEDVRAMLSLDSIGIYRQEPGSQRLPFPFSAFYPDRGDFLAFIGNLRSRACVVAATRGFRKGTAFPVAAGAAPESVEGVTWSDHASFWRYGYPAVQVTDTGAFRAASHTTADDTFDKIDFDALAHVTVGLLAATLELADARVDPAGLEDPRRALLLHGAVVLLAGLFAGAPLWTSIVRARRPETRRAWRVAHATLLGQGLLMVGVAAVSPHLALDASEALTAAYSLVAAGYGFAFAMLGGAWTGLRGLTPRPWGAGTILFVGHAVGAVGSAIGVALVALGAARGV